MTDLPALAYFGGRLATGLRDVTALDSQGFWAAVATFEGDCVCSLCPLRRCHPLAAASSPMAGPGRRFLAQFRRRNRYGKAVEQIKTYIAAGQVY